MLHKNLVIALLLGAVACDMTMKQQHLNYTMPCVFKGEKRSCQVTVDIKKRASPLDPSNPEDPTPPNPGPAPAPNSTLPMKATWPMPTAPGQHCDYPMKRLHQNDTHEVYASFYAQSTTKFEDWTFPADLSALYWPQAE